MRSAAIDRAAARWHRHPDRHGAGLGWAEFAGDAAAEGEDLQVNGYRTKLVRVASGECAAIGADESITIVVPTLGDWIGRTTVLACLRGPGLAELEAEVRAFIARAAP